MMGIQGIPQSYSSIIKRSRRLKKLYFKLRRRSGRPTTDAPSGDKIYSKIVCYLTCNRFEGHTGWRLLDTGGT